MADKRLYTLLKEIKDRILPLTSGGTGATTAAGAVNNLKSPLVDLIYPVGAIYTSTASTNPKTLFGGTWTQITNTFLLGAGSSYSAGSTGGASTVTLTVGQLPIHKHTFNGSTSYTSYAGNHTHTFRGGNASGGSGAYVDMYNGSPGWPGTRDVTDAVIANSSILTAHTVTVAGSISVNTGGGGEHNNMPPYLVVYMWRRTA